MSIEALKRHIDHAGVYRDNLNPCYAIEDEIRAAMNAMMTPETGYVSLRGDHYVARYFDDGSLFISKRELPGPEKKLYFAIMRGDVDAVQRMIMDVAQDA